MNNNFQSAVEYVLANEGGIVDNINDLGGTTNYGVSLRIYKELELPNATADDIKNLSKDMAVRFYRKHYWLDTYDEIVSQNICNYLFDMAVNMGPANAHKTLQRAIWGVTAKPQDLMDDGIFGINTIHLTNLYSNNILPSLRTERWAYYRLIIAANHKLKEFEQGWFNRTYK